MSPDYRATTARLLPDYRATAARLPHLAFPRPLEAFPPSPDRSPTGIVWYLRRKWQARPPSN